MAIKDTAVSKSGRAVATKQPLPVSERLRRLFTSLCAQIDGGHFTNAVKTCDQSMPSYFLLVTHINSSMSVLRLEPNDGDALQTKLFLLLQTEQYNAALSLISARGDPSSYAFEQAYSLYRLQREEAADILSTMKQKTGGEERGVLHLEAQLVRPKLIMFQIGKMNVPSRITAVAFIKPPSIYTINFWTLLNL
jgi:signal recognition particle subunit SRP72